MLFNLMEKFLISDYNGCVTKYLPFIFLISTFSLFGIIWIIFDFDPDIAPWYLFATFVCLSFITITGFAGTLLYIGRMRLRRRHDASGYMKSSFKIAFFTAAFFTIILVLDILKLMNSINAFLAFLTISLFALWSYMGTKSEK